MAGWRCLRCQCAATCLRGQCESVYKGRLARCAPTVRTKMLQIIPTVDDTMSGRRPNSSIK
eukprot:3339096-Pleurochrysis_carterae.AAC.1